MRIIFGNMWNTQGHWFGVPTNAQIDGQGRAIMGKGVAYQAKKMYPMLPALLGQCLKTHGNHVYQFELGGRKLFTFPTKNSWAAQAQMWLIEQSAAELAVIARANSTQTFILPRPGCGEGGLLWGDVFAALAPLHPLDNVGVVDLPTEEA